MPSLPVATEVVVQPALTVPVPAAPVLVEPAAPAGAPPKPVLVLPAVPVLVEPPKPVLVVPATPVEPETPVVDEPPVPVLVLPEEPSVRGGVDDDCALHAAMAERDRTRAERTVCDRMSGLRNARPQSTRMAPRSRSWCSPE
jgi:hypothetical protein